jgi:ribose 5-phosphate isomerase B
MKIAIGSDHAGYDLKMKVAEHLENLGHEVEDLGTRDTQSCDYPLYASKVAQAVARGECERGMLVCGSGIGMSMVANRTPGVRAVLATEPYAAKMSRRHNDANVLCLGGRFTGIEMAFEIIDTWLEEPFEGGRHQQRVDLIDRGAGE